MTKKIWLYSRSKSTWRPSSNNISSAFCHSKRDLGLLSIKIFSLFYMMSSRASSSGSAHSQASFQLCSECYHKSSLVSPFPGVTAKKLPQKHDHACPRKWHSCVKFENNPKSLQMAECIWDIDLSIFSIKIFSLFYTVSNRASSLTSECCPEYG